MNGALQSLPKNKINSRARPSPPLTILAQLTIPSIHSILQRQRQLQLCRPPLSTKSYPNFHQRSQTLSYILTRAEEFAKTKGIDPKTVPAYRLIED
jgi:hypothetical protein